MDIAHKLGQRLAKQKPIVDQLEIIECDDNDTAPPFKHTQWQGFDVYYDDNAHVYFIIKDEKRIPLISVTTFVGLFVPDFDEEAMAMRCAQKPDYECECLNKKDWETLDVDKRAKRIKTAWKKNNKQSTEYGTIAHAACEMKEKNPDMTNDLVFATVKYIYGKKNTRNIIRQYLDSLDKILQPYHDLQYRFIAEPVLTNPRIGMAGQADLALVNDHRKTIAILDYKTNKINPKLKSSFGNLEGLFSNYPKSPWYEYSIQLSIYALMLLSQYPGYTIERMALLWMNPETGDIEPLEIDLEWIDIVRGAIKTLTDQRVFQQAYTYLK